MPVLCRPLACGIFLLLIFANAPTLLSLPIEKEGRDTVVAGTQAWKAGQASAQKGAQFAYFFDLAGNYEKVNVKTGIEISHGQIAAARELTSAAPNFDGCILCAVRIDNHSHRLIAVLANSPHLTEENSGYRIIALDQSRMEQVASTPAASPILGSPAILVGQDGKQLLASYQLDQSSTPQDQVAFALSIFTLPDLKLSQTLHEATTTRAITSGQAVDLWFSDQAYVGPNDQIYDRFDIVSRVGDTFKKTVFNPIELLSNSPDERLARYRQSTSSGGKGYFAVNYADSAAGQILVALNAGNTSPQAVLLVNARTHSLSFPIPLDQVTVHSVHLTSDASRVLVEGITWKKASDGNGSSDQMEWTGQFSVIDTHSGKTTLKIRSDNLSGAHGTFLGFTEDGATAFCARDGNLYELNLRTGTVVRVTTAVRFKFDQWTKFVSARNF